MRAEDARTKKLIDAANTACAACRGEKKNLLSQLTDAPPASSSSSSLATAGKKKTPKLSATDSPHSPVLSRTCSNYTMGACVAGHSTPAMTGEPAQ
jgi:hypothetical protein